MSGERATPGQHSGSEQGRGWVSRVRSRLRSSRSRGKMGYIRLHGELETYCEEFDLLVARAQRAGISDSFWEQDVRDLLTKAREALADGRIIDGWKHLHGARRVEIYGLIALDKACAEGHPDGDSPENEPHWEDCNALRSRAHTVREEALDELSGSDKRCVENLLGRDGLKERLSGDAVREASQILHQRRENDHLKRFFLQLQFNWLFLIGLTGIVLFLVFAIVPSFSAGSEGTIGTFASFLEPPFNVTTSEPGFSMNQRVIANQTPPKTNTRTPDVSSAGFAIFVILAGIIGASLFGMWSLRRQTHSTKTAQEISPGSLAAFRGLVGAISALIFYFAIQTPFVSLGENTAALMIFVGFAAGYSERLVPAAVEKVSGVVEESGG